MLPRQCKSGLCSVNYDAVFEKAIDRLHAEGRYRVFIDILRNKGAYPNARCFAGHNGPKPITVWWKLAEPVPDRLWKPRLD